MTAQLPSKVRLAQIASFSKSMALPPSHDEIEALACFALAAHEQELAAAAAIATLKGKGYTWNGGELWKPPLGPTPDFSLIDRLHAEIDSLKAQLATHPAPVPDAKQLSIADALESLLWPNMAVGNKAVIQAAIDALRTKTAPVPAVQPVMFIDGDISSEDADKLAKVIREFNEEDERPLAKMARIIRENPHPTNECDMPRSEQVTAVPVISDEVIDRIVIPLNADGLDEEQYHCEWHLYHDRERIRKALREYFAAPPIPTEIPTALPDEMTIKDACKFVQDMRIFDDVVVIVMRTWNACRAAMLNGGKS